MAKVKRKPTNKTTKAPADSPDLRFKDTVPLRKFRSKVIGIAGLGAVGRHVAILLGVMGHKHLYGADPDKIELKNVGTQGWNSKDVGRDKAQLLADTVTGKRSAMVGATSKFEEQVEWINTMDVFFCCVDTMRARQDIWRRVLGSRTNLQGLWLDSRMASRVIRIVAVDLSSQPDRAHYENSLYSDSEAFEGSCTDRMTVYGAYVAAGLMVSQMVNWLNGMLINKDFVLETLAVSVTGLSKKGD